MCMREMASSKGHKEGRKEGKKERKRKEYIRTEKRKNKYRKKNESDGQGFLVVVGLLLVGGHVYPSFPLFFFHRFSAMNCLLRRAALDNNISSLHTVAH